MLLDLDLLLLRDFFGAFFANPKEKMWRQFLAWDMTKPGDKPYMMSVFMILQFFRGSVPLKVPTLHPSCSQHPPLASGTGGGGGGHCGGSETSGVGVVGA